MNQYFMNRYLIKSFTEVAEDIFEDGEGHFVNSYDLESKIEAETPREAVLKFIANKLYFKAGTLDEGVEEGSSVVYCNTVDNDNTEPSETQFEAWKRGEIPLYNSYTRFSIYLLTEQTI